ncbi:LysR family transcriptional regulator [Lutimaribacter sp. EGI FJ00015]|uniref:LysR family transcriptional regulator n=1 Tax=Lutimaribacter degradans TaxID=2945989 RepID=A0ACC5ZSK6_9RHOB|nr:LysR family transcriptional regulator [Lutimaribacter sp. EGI FJ00013]MCM2561160.1 LysR family transcriptional regulator [Lutimaribacter sp. EGI FJ00013]MCO0611891.1 LysR family transcriptional regulator [Lutimaribacter sp. EGI FJ00015]MCO0634988.1 LysR family transcriptional regulator [Lutimaribacter sp. EGI FJ00014]
MNDIDENNATPSGERFVSQLDWNLLRSFVVIVEAGSITTAARRLLRGQPAVSLALKRLEEALDTRLIERGHGQFALTEAGRALYQECADLYGGVARLPDLAARAEVEVSGQVSIALASHVVTPLLDDLLARTHADHPRVRFRLRTATSAEVARAVQDRTASFGICLANRQNPDLDYAVLYREFFGFYCGPDHPLFGRAGLTLDDLRGRDAVAFETDDLNDALRPVALLRRQSALDQTVVGRSSQLEEVRRMILCGLGIGALPVHVAARDVADGLLWRLPPYDDPPAVDIFLVANPRKRLNRAEALMIDDLRRSIATMPLGARTYPGG